MRAGAQVWSTDPRVLERAAAAVVPSGTVLVREGRAGSAAFVVVDGDARIEQQGRTVASIGPGSVIGELSLLDGGMSAVTVTATSRLELRVIDRRAFRDALAAHPDLLARLLETVAARVRAGLPPHEWGMSST